jgi:hypothetical protein
MASIMEKLSYLLFITVTYVLVTRAMEDVHSTSKGESDKTWAQECDLIRDIKNAAEYTQLDDGIAFNIIEHTLRRTTLPEALPTIDMQWRKCGGSDINHTLRKYF